MFWHELIPGLQSFIVRNEAKTIPKTVLKTLLRMLKHPAAKHKKNPFEIVGGINFPQRILWDNGGITEFGGLDDPDKILGGDYHMGWYNEVQREKKEESFSNLLGCFVGDRAGPLPAWVPWSYRLFLDLNPTAPGHFVYRRKKEAEDARARGEEVSLEWYNVLHEDNPMLSIWENGVFLGFNERGKRNEKDLLDIYPPGYMRDRMVYGIPKGAEGMVYPMWSEDRHVKTMRRGDFGIETKWRWAIDIGGRDPHAIGIFAETQNRKHHLFKEVCKSSRDGTKISDVIEIAESIHQKYDIPKPSAVFIDWNVKDFFLQLAEKGYPVVLAEKDILSGVEVVKEAMANEDFFVNRHSIEERDPTLGTALQGFKEEVGSYSHKPEEKRNGTIKDDEPDPTQRDKHFCDLVRYYFKACYLASEGYDINYGGDYISSRDDVFGNAQQGLDVLSPQQSVEDYLDSFGHN